MPKCVNDDSRSYTGNEPSPKGFGWCAHAEVINKVRKGTDGGKWIISEDKNNRKFWKRLSKDDNKSVAHAGPTKSVTKKKKGTRKKSSTSRGRSTSSTSAKKKKTESSRSTAKTKKTTTKRKRSISPSKKKIATRERSTSPKKKNTTRNYTESPKRSVNSETTKNSPSSDTYYWKMIAEAAWGKPKQHSLSGIYSKKDLKGLQTFVEKKYKELSKVYDPYTYGKKKPTLEIGDDSYHDFKMDVIGKGKTTFQKAIEDPKSMIKKLDTNVYRYEEGFPEEIL